MNKKKYIPVENGIGIMEQRQLIDFQSLNRALTQEEFMQIVIIYKGVVDRLVKTAEKEGIEI
ncbi:hypothetical protein [Clostridium sp. ZBS12]|uniref:hypothetical protein n=1 Tax=Clostridium sp. ZBS12 TaxID=2949972 RepID=UPI002079A773|nr:hypothetical protein [Clostridium sp. ZBS12]